MVDNPQLNTPGEILSAARRKAGFSLAELAVLTKIQQDMLQAIERDEYHKISGDLYVKSFMASFAREVGVDPELVVGMYRDFSGGVSDGSTGSLTNQWDEDTVEVSSVGLAWGKIITTVVAVVIAGLLGFYIFQQFSGNDEPTTAAEVPAKPLVEDNKTPQSAAIIGRKDTLSFGWQVTQPVIEEVIPAGEVSDLEPVIKKTIAKDSASRILENNGRGHLPAAYPGDQKVEFAGKGSWPVVLRLVCNQPVDIKIKRDAENVFSTVAWPASGAMGDPLPDRKLIAGQAYEVRQGYAVYWGAGDHFSVILPQIKGMEICVNGISRDLSSIKPGQEIILDAPRKAAGRQ